MRARIIESQDHVTSRYAERLLKWYQGRGYLLIIVSWSPVMGLEIFSNPFAQFA